MKKQSGLKIIVTGGGTAGHINPAVATAKRMMASGAEVLYVGSGASTSMDERVVTQNGLRFHGLNLLTPTLKPSLVTFRAIWRILAAIRDCLRLIRVEKPKLVVGTGGYVSVAMILAAWLSRVPTFIEEQNIYPGVSNRFLSRLVRKVFLTFDDSKQHFPRGVQHKLITTGLPLLHLPKRTSAENYARRLRGKLRLLVFGGSNGSVYLNNTICEILPQLSGLEELEILLAAGTMNYEKFTDAIDLDEYPNFKVVPYITDMTAQFEMASLVVCRAGSSTIFEIIAAAVPAIVIPSPNVMGDHQRPNAEYLAASGGAMLLEENHLPPYKLLEIIAELYHNRDRLIEMKKALDKQTAPNALDRIEKELLAAAGRIQ